MSPSLVRIDARWVWMIAAMLVVVGCNPSPEVQDEKVSRFGEYRGYSVTGLTLEATADRFI